MSKIWYDSTDKIILVSIGNAQSSRMITNNTGIIGYHKEDFILPKNKLEDVVFTLIMATVMVYGMVVYNVALNTGGVTGETFFAALYELPIMAPIAFVLEFFFWEKSRKNSLSRLLNRVIDRSLSHMRSQFAFAALCAQS